MTMRIDRRRMLMSAVVAALGGAAGLRALAQSNARVIPIVARKFVFLPSEVALKRGEPVVLEFTSPEVVMGFYAPDLNLRALIIPGETARIAYTPEKAGTFPFICDVFCGDGHEAMGGKIVVS
jgi:cytochrome c oxidase subunit 2